MAMFSKKHQFTDPLKERISKLLRTADELVQRKRYADALLEIERAYKLDPKNLYIRSFLERTRYLMQKEEEQQAKVFGETNMLIERRMQVISQLLTTAEDFVKANNDKRALAVIAKVYQIDPKNYYAQAFSERIEVLMQAEAAAGGTQPRITPPAVQSPQISPPHKIQTEIPEITEKPPDKVIQQQPIPTSEPQEEAGRLAMYRELLKECWADGIITPEEYAMLHRVRSQYAISLDDHCRLEVDIKIDAYVDALRIVWQDGVVTDNEQEVLEIMRKTYGITPEEQAAAEKKFAAMRIIRQTHAMILIVDPNQEDLISVARALINQDYNVKVARRPFDALRFLSSNTPDLILSEVVFPELDTDGFEFYQKVRSDERFSQIPFLMMTYPGDARIVRAGLRMGVDYFIPKPLHIDFMVAIVEGKLKSGRQTSAQK